MSLTFILSIFSNHPHVAVIAGLLLLFLLIFIGLFMLPFFRVRSELKNALKELNQQSSKGSLADLSKIFGSKSDFRHLVSEFVETLHPQKELNEATGMLEVVRNRSTVPAGVFFKPEVIVDLSLRTDFFKHLPGILTGIGIIGTFIGLLQGLTRFNISDDSAVVRTSLNSLLAGVTEAFLVSAAAICLAMLITIFEKWFVTILNSNLEQLVQKIDSIFEGGAGEEYLERLVNASENSSAQMSMLKDAFVTELTSVLHKISEQQINAFKASTSELGAAFRQSLVEELSSPLKQLSDNMQGVRQDQGNAVHSLLSQVLKDFSTQLENLFGGQISGINQAQQETISALNTAVSKIELMAKSFEDAGKKGSQDISDTLTNALKLASDKQEQMNQNMENFINVMKQRLAEAGDESNQQMQKNLSNVTGAFETLVQSMQSQVTQSNDQILGSTRQQVEAQQRQHESLESHLKELTQSSNAAIGKMTELVTQVERFTSSALDKMNLGANELYRASTEFAAAGGNVEATLTKSAQLSTTLTSAATSLTQVGQQLNSGMQDYQTQRNSLKDMMASMQSVVDTAKREVAMTDALVKKLQDSAQQLSQANTEIDSYLENVTKVLASSQQTFSEGMIKIVGEANLKFHEQLNSSVGLLRTGIEDLQDVVDSIPTR
ncbi:anti-phage ZorAB system protein ZorA [Rheinheimera texasensis]|uniref:anti-phage ZorAB system protein ZorA n=1 Tax=Rheinheimera texasensis TaxID=306205 RepID=UPI0004E1AB98|nr:anti-phage ZorAB system protein ZorA [Rheinheimera texasensis]